LKETAHSLATIGRGGIKVLGSRLASSQLAVASDVNDPTCKLLSMEHCRGVVGFVESSNGEQLIEVLAGTQLGELFSYLLDHNLSLPSSPGVITYQTVGGVLASCTHGQGMKQSSISDCVDSVRVALASGEILVVQHDDDRINAFRASLGCLGIIISVRMHVVPARVLRCVKQSTDVESLIQNMTQWNYAHEYFKNWWFPATHAGANEGDIHLVFILNKFIDIWLLGGFSMFLQLCFTVAN
jgi:FAD/FMN-containing dehydrogenase